MWLVDTCFWVRFRHCTCLAGCFCHVGMCSLGCRAFGRFWRLCWAAWTRSCWEIWGMAWHGLRRWCRWMILNLLNNLRYVHNVFFEIIPFGYTFVLLQLLPDMDHKQDYARMCFVFAWWVKARVGALKKNIIACLPGFALFLIVECIMNWSVFREFAILLL